MDGSRECFANWNKHTKKDKYYVVLLTCEGHFQANRFLWPGLCNSHPDDGLQIILLPQTLYHFKIIFHILNISF